MGLRVVEGDEHYGHIGLGELAESAASVFSNALLPSLFEPQLILKAVANRRTLAIDVEDVLVWDVKNWDYWSDFTPDIAGGEDVVEFVWAGITKDNTRLGTDPPTDHGAGEGSRPGGNGAAVAGQAAGAAGSVLVGQEQPTAYVDMVDFLGNANEQQDATGHINKSFTSFQRTLNTPYRVDGHTAHYLATAAHYHLWIESQNAAAVVDVSLGAKVRKMSVDFEEMLFDRAVFLSIQDALVLTN